MGEVPETVLGTEGGPVSAGAGTALTAAAAAVF